MMRHISHHVARALRDLEKLFGPIKQQPHAGRHEADEELTQIDCDSDSKPGDVSSQRADSEDHHGDR